MRPILSAILTAWCLLHAGFAFALGGPPLKNGVALHGPLTWGRTDPDRTLYLDPVYEGPNYRVPVELLRDVKSAGFDFIRLTVDPGPFLALQGPQLDALDRQMLSVIAQIRQAGLDVLVDFHPIGMVKTYAPDRLESVESDGLFAPYAYMIRHCAHVLAPLGTEHIAIEPMNEPQLGYSAEEIAHWQSMMEILYTAVRMESPTMTVIVTGGRGGDIDGLLNIDPKFFAGGNVRYSFHYYLPYIFTNQGVHSPIREARIWAFAAGLPYPARRNDMESFRMLVRQRVSIAPDLTPQEKKDILADGDKQIEAYFNGKGTRAAINADFDRVNTWAEQHHIDPQQILLGEFDATQAGPGNDGALPRDRAHWIADVRQVAEQYGFHWSFWALYGAAASGMTLVSVSDPQHIDKTTADALDKSTGGGFFFQ